MPDATGMILSKDEENDAEVRREDQDKINEFGRLNARRYEVKNEASALRSLLEKLDDASTELMMGNGDLVMLRLGEAMFEATEGEATQFCEEEGERYRASLEGFVEEESSILERMAVLKTFLYGRFGKSINLEEK